MINLVLVFLATATASVVPDANITAIDGPYITASLATNGDRPSGCEPDVGLPGAVYMCTREGFTGECTWTRPQRCQYFLENASDAPHSIGPNFGGYCTIHPDRRCRLPPMTIVLDATHSVE